MNTSPRPKLSKFGKEVEHWLVDYRISKRELARLAGVSKHSLGEVVRGHRSGERFVKEKVIAAMKKHEAENPMED